MIDPDVAMRVAVGNALQDIGVASRGDEEIIEDFITALKEHGYVVVREADLEVPSEGG
jgi:hypothetical protein